MCRCISDILFTKILMCFTEKLNKTHYLSLKLKTKKKQQQKTLCGCFVCVESQVSLQTCQNLALGQLLITGTIRLDATEGTTITLTCPHDVGGSHTTWSRGSGDIQQERGFYVSPIENTLTITSVQLGDSGLYYCDGKPAVYLTVIKGTKTPTTLTTRPTPKTRQISAATPSKAAAPPPATTTVQSTPPENLRTTTSTDTTTARKKRQNRKHGEKGKKTGNKTSPTTTTTTTTTGTTGTYESASKGHQPVLRLVCGVVFSFLVLVIIIIIIFIIYFTQRRRLKRRGNEERFHVYDEIQDGFLLQPTNGGGSLAEPTATYCMAGFSAGSNQNDPTYSTIPDLPPVQKKTNTSLHIESPYSLIGNTFTDEKNKGSSQLSDNMYFLLEKPKAPGNNKDQYL
ncbi:uncharacterized protein LOC125904202 isoform X1 [Epinephelus fuscoguttatus]|uniref:uncharacterized protein LOC125904202 isoform X1 n=1 Tax=Epinephelus fuscoguttatus TaxID=293821 RepID=UPI0020D14A62|nr:uncharacterized protein LOC125904202 isoform X1 [Epinephelus fuscoguttatus]